MLKEPYSVTLYDSQQLSELFSNPYFTIPYVILLIFGIVVTWKIFVKAGAPGWYSVIPFFNSYQMFKLFWGGSGWKFLLLLIPFVNIVISIMLSIRMGRAFGKRGLFNVGMVLLAPIFQAILAFGNSKYIGPNGIAIETTN